MMYQSTFEDAGDVCRIVIDVDYDTGDSVGREELEDGAIVDAEGGDVETFKEELSEEFIGGMGYWFGKTEEHWELIEGASKLKTIENSVLPGKRLSVEFDIEREMTHQRASAWTQS